ncbi:hypothetical protein [Yunchengibacter salinarum]|uniref:hypothetical protein n=1 Tax=Yunchengibacter salinarum TaxID=3133399 RepID=UPI0035B63CD1
MVEDLVGAGHKRTLSVDDAVAALKARPGLIPVAIRPTGGVCAGELYLADLGRHPFREWQFMYSVQHLAQSGALGEILVTDLSLLERGDLPQDTLDPAGFIFHVSRCGSTLMAKALARLESNLVINQGGPLQRGFWAAITDDFRVGPGHDPRSHGLFRNLVRLMARRRRGVEQRAFVKFISWNIRVQDFVRAAYGDVPALFLYRDPVEVIASVKKETTAVLHARGTRQAAMLTGLDVCETHDMSDTAYLAACYAAYFRTALGAGAEDGLSVLNYIWLKKPDHFRDILVRGLGYEPDVADLAVMQEQFRYHSKDDTDKATFSGDSAEKQAALDNQDVEEVARWCGALTEHLDRSPINLFPSGAEGAGHVRMAVNNG